MAATKTPTVPALERGLKILEMVARSRNGQTFSQLAAQLEYPKSSIHTLLVTFERLGYLQRMAPSGRYVAGLNLMRIAGAASQGITLRLKAGPVLCELARRTGLTSHLAILERREALLVAKVEPAGSAPLATWIGKRIDYHCTSLGKALIAWLDEEELAQMVRERRMLRHNENTICTLARLRQDLQKIRQLGYSLDDEEEELGYRCVGAPVINAAGLVEAALSISGTLDQIPLEQVPRLGSLVQDSAMDMSRRLAGAGHAGVSE